MFNLISNIAKNLKNNKKNDKKKIVVLVGNKFYPKIETPDFNYHDSYWNGEQIVNIATRKAFKLNRQKFYDFYNNIRIEYRKKGFGNIHKNLKNILRNYDVTIINLGIDDAFEKAGYKKVLHINGMYNQLLCDFKDGGCSKTFKYKTFNKDIECPKCHNSRTLRPNLCWFGEDPNFEVWKEASILMESCDLYIQIGASIKDRLVSSLVDKCYAEKLEINTQTTDVDEYVFQYVIEASPAEGIETMKKHLKEYIKGTRVNVSRK